MLWIVRKVTRWALWTVFVIVCTIVGVRALQAQLGEPLSPWHTEVPPELGAEATGRADWAGWLAAEDAAFAFVRDHVSAVLGPADRGGFNRYDPDSPVHPGRFARDWNRSFVLEPEGRPRGAAVLLHGLTDSPYSMRHLAELYRSHGFLALAIRIPGHGTVPAGLSEATGEDWSAATQLAVREAARRVGPGLPLHVVGYSNGGALAVKYALDALENPGLPRPTQLVLLSPMVGVTGFARFAGLAGLPAFLPAFAKAAWLGVVPEFNPFKYNSFPVNAARQSFRVSQGLQRQVAALARDGGLAGLAPVLTFQSVMDSTVSAPAVLAGLYAFLPANGSELVLFDLNRSAHLSPLLRADAQARLERIVPPAPRPYRLSILTNAAEDSAGVSDHDTGAGEVTGSVQPTGLSFPPDVYSLSHIALPFPVTDPLYGLSPESPREFGLSLGTLAPRGERDVLVSGLDSLLRITSNPFYPYVERRIGEAIERDLAGSR